MIYKQYAYPNKILKILLDKETTAKVKLAWNLDLKFVSVCSCGQVDTNKVTTSMIHSLSPRAVYTQSQIPVSPAGEENNSLEFFVVEKVVKGPNAAFLPEGIRDQVWVVTVDKQAA